MGQGAIIVLLIMVAVLVVLKGFGTLITLDHLIGNVRIVVGHKRNIEVV